MSKLKNAPLEEVIFELRWKVTNKNDLLRCQYLQGDLYSILKQEYPHRESLVHPEVPIDLLINNPVHRFRKSDGEYPLFQVGPGIITLNTTDNSYDWDDYFIWCTSLMEAFFKTYPHAPEEKFQPNLIYIDFFKINPLKNNVLDFVNEFLKVDINQGFYNTDKYPKLLNWGIAYEAKLGQLGITLNTGKNGRQEDGIILQTKLDGISFDAGTNINSWLHEAHEFCGQLFKDMTKGDLYDSFK